MYQQKITIIAFHGCNQNKELFKSLLKSMQKNTRDCDWYYEQGPYSINQGFGWYNYKQNNNLNLKHHPDIDQEERMKNIQTFHQKYSKRKKIVLIGFSEGGQFALDISRYLPNVIGIIALSPAYHKGLNPELHITSTVVLISSPQDTKIAQKYCKKWKKICNNYIEILHNKGHKVYLNQPMRETIKRTIFK